jgi:hypothetical protein
MAGVMRSEAEDHSGGGDMLDRISTKLHKHANGWLVLVFLLANLIFNAVLLPAGQAELRALSGGVGPIDLEYFYTPGEVYSMVASYGETGRATYRTFELTGDILYQLVYTGFFCLLISWLLQHGFAPHSPVQKLNVLPLALWLSDLFENLGIVSMLSVYPATPAPLAWMAAAFTLLKWLFIGTTLVVLLLGLVMALKNRFRKQGVTLATPQV